MILIGFTGYKQSGKNTVASTLAMYLPLNKVIYTAFADGIKKQVCDEFEISLKQLESIKCKPIVRKVLQFVGTEWGRQEKGESVWINLLDEQLKQQPQDSVVLITDVRFPNEAAWIRSKGGIIVRVERKGQVNNDTHDSEKFIDRISADTRVHNSGNSLNDLGREVKWLSVFIKEKYNL